MAYILLLASKLASRCLVQRVLRFLLLLQQMVCTFVVSRTRFRFPTRLHWQRVLDWNKSHDGYNRFDHGRDREYRPIGSLSHHKRKMMMMRGVRDIRPCSIVDKSHTESFEMVSRKRIQWNYSTIDLSFPLS